MLLKLILLRFYKCQHIIHFVILLIYNNYFTIYNEKINILDINILEINILLHMNYSIMC